MEVEPTTKRCEQCKQEKPLVKFHKRKTPDGRSAICIVCQQANSAERDRAFQERMEAWRREREAAEQERIEQRKRDEEEKRQQEVLINLQKDAWYMEHSEKTCIACGKTLSSRNFDIMHYSYGTLEDLQFQIQMTLSERCTQCLEAYRNRLGVPCVVCGQKFRSKLSYYAGYTLFGGGTGISLHCAACANTFAALPESKQRFYLQSRIHLAFPSPQVIYAEKDPLSHEIRYIGRTGNATTRHSEHTRDKKSGRSMYRTEIGDREWYSKSNWIYDLSQQGLKPVQEILYTVEPSAYVVEYEMRYIWHALQQCWSILNQESTHKHLIDRIRRSSINFLCAPFEQLVSEQFFSERGIEAFLRIWFDKPVSHEPETPDPLPAPSVSLSRWLNANYPARDLDE